MQDSFLKVAPVKAAASAPRLEAAALTELNSAPCALTPRASTAPKVLFQPVIPHAEVFTPYVADDLGTLRRAAAPRRACLTPNRLSHR